MRWGLFILVAALVHPAAPAPALAQAAGGYGDYVDWEGWSRVVPGQRAALVSSWDRTGENLDYNQYESPPGFQTGNLRPIAGVLRGPGILYRFWMPHKNALDQFGVRMYFDGEPTPRIDTNSKVLLGGSFGYFDEPLVDTFAGGQTCYEPIPFRDSVIIESQNRSGKSNYYQYSARLFPGGTPITSYTGTLTPEAASARSSMVDMFENAGQHPAGTSGTALQEEFASTTLSIGEAVTIADLTGPGLVRKLNVRMDGATDAELDGLNLSVFYDFETEPAIDVPVGWFFGAGHGRAPYKSIPLGTDSPDGFYSYWPMPFHGRVRFVLTNHSTNPIHVDGAVVEHEIQAIANDAGYLHALATDHTRVFGEPPHVFLEATGAGHYVGNLLYVEQEFDSQYFLQGDELIVVDGVDELHGTGLEDAYNGGHYYNWGDPIAGEPEGPSPHSAFRPLAGILRVDLEDDPDLARADQYRWMIGERVPFAQSLEVSIETRYALSGSRWTSVAFWYQLPTEVVAVPFAEAIAHNFELRPIAPNPVTGSAEIRFWLSVDQMVTLELFDVDGRRVQTIVAERMGAGSHGIRWKRGSLANGIYFLRLKAGDQVAIRKVVLTR